MQRESTETKAARLQLKHTAVVGIPITQRTPLGLLQSYCVAVVLMRSCAHTTAVPPVKWYDLLRPICVVGTTLCTNNNREKVLWRGLRCFAKTGTTTSLRPGRRYGKASPPRPLGRAWGPIRSFARSRLCGECMQFRIKWLSKTSNNQFARVVWGACREVYVSTKMGA